MPESVQPEGLVDSFVFFGHHLAFPAEAGKPVAAIAIIALGGIGAGLARHMPLWRDESRIGLPVIRAVQARMVAGFDPLKQVFEGFSVPVFRHFPVQQRAGGIGVYLAQPEFVAFFWTKCHISSISTTGASATTGFSGNVWSTYTSTQ